jgi:hypothetical protein
MGVSDRIAQRFTGHLEELDTVPDGE